MRFELWDTNKVYNSTMGIYLHYFQNIWDKKIPRELTMVGVLENGWDERGLDLEKDIEPLWLSMWVDAWEHKDACSWAYYDKLLKHVSKCKVSIIKWRERTDLNTSVQLKTKVHGKVKVTEKDIQVNLCNPRFFYLAEAVKK